MDGGGDAAAKGPGEVGVQGAFEVGGGLDGVPRRVEAAGAECGASRSSRARQTGASARRAGPAAASARPSAHWR